MWRVCRWSRGTCLRQGLKLNFEWLRKEEEGGNLSIGEEQEMVRRLREEPMNSKGEGGEGGSKEERGAVGEEVKDEREVKRAKKEEA